MRVEYRGVTAIRSFVFRLKGGGYRVMEMEAYCTLKRSSSVQLHTVES